MRYRRSEGLTWDDADDRTVILDAQGARMLTLNPVGSLLWKALDGPKTVEELAQHLHEQFGDVAIEQLHGDAAEFVENLLGEGLVVAVDGEG